MKHKHKLQIAGITLGVVSLIGGIIDVYIQYSLGENAQWRMPIILIGFGVGLPLFMVPFCDWSASPNTELSEEEYAQTNLDGGFLSMGSGEVSGGDSGYSDGSGDGE